MVVLAVGIAVAGVSLMLLSRGAQEYQTLEHGPLNATTEDLRTDNNAQTQSTVEPTSIEDGTRRGNTLTITNM